MATGGFRTFGVQWATAWGGCGGRVVGRVTCVCILSVAVSAETLHSVNSVKAETGPPLTGVCLSPAFTCPRTCVL